MTSTRRRIRLPLQSIALRTSSASRHRWTSNLSSEDRASISSAGYGPRPRGGCGGCVRSSVLGRNTVMRMMTSVCVVRPVRGAIPLNATPVFGRAVWKGGIRWRSRTPRDACGLADLEPAQHAPRCVWTALVDLAISLYRPVASRPVWHASPRNTLRQARRFALRRDRAVAHVPRSGRSPKVRDAVVQTVLILMVHLGRGLLSVVQSPGYAVPALALLIGCGVLGPALA